MAFSTPVGLSWDSPPPPTESVRTDGRTEVRTDGHVTITSQPKFLGLIGYQISLAMELRWQTLRAGSAITSQPKFLGLMSGLIGYQISLAMELRYNKRHMVYKIALPVDLRDHFIRYVHLSEDDTSVKRPG